MSSAQSQRSQSLAQGLDNNKDTASQFNSRSSLIFQLNYNMVMLACHYGSINVLNYLVEKVAHLDSNPKHVKRDLTHLKYSLGGIQPSHLACFIGNLQILRILKNKFYVNYSEKTEHGLTGLHCAA